MTQLEDIIVKRCLNLDRDPRDEALLGGDHSDATRGFALGNASFRLVNRPRESPEQIKVGSSLTGCRSFMSEHLVYFKTVDRIFLCLCEAEFSSGLRPS